MTKAEKQKMQARERARRHYEKKKAARENTALDLDVEQAPEQASRHLTIVEAQAEVMSQPDTFENVVEASAAEQTTPQDEPTPEEKEPSSPPLPTKTSDGWRRLTLFLRGCMILGLTVLMGILQYDFYRQHDLAPNLALAFTAAVELGFFSLVTLKFDGAFDWVRRSILGVLFIYFVATLIFQLGYSAREKVIRQNSVKIGDLDNQIKTAQDSLAVATKGRSWENMALFGKQVSDLQSLKANAPKSEALGITHSEVALGEAVLLVVMRVLLLAISGLNTVRLREGLKA